MRTQKCIFVFFAAIIAVVFFAGIHRNSAWASSWPVDKENLLLDFATSFDDIFMLDAEGRPIIGALPSGKGLARLDHYGRLLLQGGSYSFDYAGKNVTTSCKASGELSLELTFQPTTIKNDDPASLVSLITQSGANFAVAQRDDAILFSLATSKNKGDNRNEWIQLVKLSDPASSHIVITYSPGKLACYRNGEQIYSSGAFKGDLSVWEEAELIVGNPVPSKMNWSGFIEGITLYDRALGDEDIRHEFVAYQEKIRARPKIDTLRIRGKLLGRSRVPTLDELAPYTQSLSVFNYEVEEVLEGNYDGKYIYVAHWGILNNQPLPFKDTSLMQTYLLDLELFSDNKQLESENLSDGIIEDFTIPLYYDAGGLSLGIQDSFVHAEARGKSIVSLQQTESTINLIGTIDSDEKFLVKNSQRSVDIQNQLKALEDEREKAGGWKSWNQSLEAFRKDINQNKSELQQSGMKAFQTKEGYLFTSFDFTYLLTSNICPTTADAGAESPCLPLDVIAEASAQLRARNIDLIFVPVPTRGEIIPEYLSNSALASLAVSSARKQFLMELLRHDIEIIDLLPGFLEERRRTDDTLSNVLDSHWNYHAIDNAAKQIAKRLQRYDFFQQNPKTKIFYTTQTLSLEGKSSLFKHMTEGEREKYSAPTWTIEKVLAPDGIAYTDDENSPILFVGDSYTAFLSRESAGITAHLAKELGMPIALLGGGGNGPTAMRNLARKGKAFIDNRRVIIWMIASRYLILPRHQDWMPTQLP